MVILVSLWGNLKYPKVHSGLDRRNFDILKIHQIMFVMIEQETTTELGGGGGGGGGMKLDIDVS